MLCEDVLDLIQPLYAQAGNNHVGSQQHYFQFYRYISSIKRLSSNDDWKIFCDKLYFHVAISCKKLQKQRVPDTYSVTMSDPQQYATPDFLKSHASFDSDDSSESSESSSWLPRRKEHNRPPQNGQTTNPDTNYVVLLKEHGDIAEGDLKYHYGMVNSDLSTWRCVVTLGNRRAKGTGPNKKLAKYAASKEMCTLLGLSTV
jgi:hypothetical protein